MAEHGGMMRAGHQMGRGGMQKQGTALGRGAMQGQGRMTNPGGMQRGGSRNEVRLCAKALGHALTPGGFLREWC